MLALDIGAGNTAFGKDLIKLNPQIKTVFCGDPIFKKQDYDFAQSVSFNMKVFLSRCVKVLTPEEIQDIIEQSKTGVYKILAQYKEIPIKDNSLDLVTLNSPHPFIYPGKAGFDEFKRVLKPGGIFYFGHSRQIYLEFEPKEFELIEGGTFVYGENNIAQIPNSKLQFPMSPVIKSNLIAMQMMKKGYIKNRSGSIYGTGPTKIQVNPSWKAWRKV